MSSATFDILLLRAGSAAVLVVLTIFGEAMRARAVDEPRRVWAEVFMTRVESWWAMVILFALALLMGGGAVVMLFAIAAFGALREFYTYSARVRADHLALALAFFVVLPLQFAFVWLDWQRLFGVFIPVYAFLLLPVVSAWRGDPQRFLLRVAETQWGLMICVFCISHIPALMWLDLTGIGERAVLLIAFLVMVVQIGDLADFYFGKHFGRRRLVPGLSPKTWEGALFGVVVAALAGFALAWLTPFGPWAAAAMAAIAAATGHCGNLVLAAIRREKGLRDWSHLIPGHGGFLNQLDSVIFAAPVFYHLTRLWWIP